VGHEVARGMSGFALELEKINSESFKHFNWHSPKRNLSDFRLLNRLLTILFFVGASFGSALRALYLVDKNFTT
jgi:hypothetical protein